MISRLTGTIVHIDPKYVVLDVSDVGYKVFTPADSLSKIGKDEKKVTLWTYLAVRENSMDLYGFITLAELGFFELLLTVSGIGPKTALGILNAASVHSLETAIQTGDTSHLTKVSGIGKKVAEKIVLELKDKVDKMTSGVTVNSSDGDVIEALKALGYSPQEARDVMKKLSKDLVKTGDKVKEALKILGK